MKKLVAIWMCLGIYLSISCFCIAQTTYVHETLMAEGKIPQAVLNTARENYLSNNETNDEVVLDEFNVMSGYAINKLLWSGKIIFGDTVTRYLDRIVDVILEDDPQLRKQIQIYTVKSAVVNAFTTSEGFIFVNLGLIERCENEAQLAYILSHEISHYVKKHSINRFKFKKQEDDATKFTLNASKREQIDYTKRLNASNYSKSQETEADEHGLELFHKTNYHKNAILTGFAMLGKSDILADSTVFDKTYLNNPYIENFDARYGVKSSISNIGKRYGEDDEYTEDEEGNEDKEKFSTHPAIEERIENLNTKLKNTVIEGEYYLASTQQEFEYIQKRSSYELLTLLLNQTKYIDALHQTFALNQKYGKSVSADMAMAKATYGIAKFATVNERVFMEHEYDYIAKDSTNWYASLSDLSKENRAIYAFTWLFSNLDKGIDTIYTKKAIVDLLVDVHMKHDKLLEDEATDSLSDTNLLKTVWHDKIRTHTRYDEFLTQAKEIFDEYKEFEDFKEDAYNMYALEQKVSKARYHGFKLGIDNIMITDVRYLKMKVRNKKMAPLKTIIQREEYAIESIQESAAKMNLNTKILDPKGLDKAHISLSVFNDVNTINAWYSAQPDVDGMYSFVPSNYVEIQELAKRNGTNHLARMVFLDLKGPIDERLVARSPVGLIMTIPTMYFFPYTAYRLFANRKALVMTEVYDIDKGRPLLIYNVSGQSFRKTNMKQNIFFQLAQIKSK